MRVLLHICCGPCAIVPMRELLAEGHDVEAAFVNPNIHPFTEFERRLGAARAAAADAGVRIAHEDPYGLIEFLRAVVFHEGERCPICYRMRLDRAAELAAALGFDAFTTTMLVSTQQDHEAIRRAGEEASRARGIEFLYRDFRPRVMDGVRESKAREMYRQQYCGCVFSEWERYRKAA
ncbi:MAG: epoxyqueuosine reductase QueH [Candidatus Eisenbacteria bacterium]|nr:epoxyqueuosine reductase QueH [Candidatus Eisenbacteria bacterium]